MYRVAVFALLLLLLVGCKSFEDLEPGNKLAIENQSNLEKNVVRIFDNFKKVGESTGEWDESDEEIWGKQRATTMEQLAINYAWLIVIQHAIESDSLDAGFFVDLMKDLPDWIKDGKKIYDLIKGKWSKGDE